MISKYNFYTISENFEFSYMFWHENTYIITDKWKRMLSDYYIADLLGFSIDDFFDIMVVEFNATYISTRGYIDKLVFKNMTDVLRIVEWLNSTLVLLKMDNKL